MIDLFRAFPNLKDSLPYTALGKFPTPVQKLSNLSAEFGADVYIKRDDLSAVPYGGNKIRKLEFLLGKALVDGKDTVLTFGCVGSNHALATGIYAEKLGLHSVSVLHPQPNSEYARKNLLLSYVNGIEMRHYHSFKKMDKRYRKDMAKRDKDRNVMVIPAGGSSPLGNIGFVNAAYELKAQIDRGELPVPDVIYVALGTMGTAVGLYLGLRTLGLQTKVVAVRVVDEQYSPENKFVNLYYSTLEELYLVEPDFPNSDYQHEFVELRNGYIGDGYACFTPDGIATVKWLKRFEDVILEPTYTGKAFAALIDDINSGILKNKNVLFWNTYNSHDLSDMIKGVDYHELPHDFHSYFETEVQKMNGD